MAKYIIKSYGEGNDMRFSLVGELGELILFVAGLFRTRSGVRNSLPAQAAGGLHFNTGNM
jgi:hypothetical protein